MSPAGRGNGRADDPLQRASVRWGCAAAVFASTTALYLSTLAPTVTFVDSGELIVAAHTLGVAHPPGFPLYVLLAHAATWLPFGTVAVRVHILSAVCGAAAAAVVTLALAEIFLTLPRDTRVAGRVAKKSDAHRARPRPAHGAIVALLATGLVFGFSRTLWSYATVAEVYTLNTWLLAGIFCLLMRWRRVDALSGDGWLRAAALLFGLALGVHHVTVALTLPGIVWLVYATSGGAAFQPRRLGPLFLCALAGLLVYLYLPLAAAQASLFNWGDPRTLQRVWWHVTGRQYQSYFSVSAADLAGEAAGFVRRAGREFGPWWLPAVPLLAAVGGGALLRRDRALGGALAAIIGLNLAYAWGYGIAEDKEAYYLPTYLVVVLAAGIGALQLIESATSRAMVAVATGAILLVPVAALAHNLRFNDRARYTLARDYVDNILTTVEPNGMLLTLDWQVWAPMLYTRTIDALRRDVVVIDVNLMRRSWYFDYLRRQYPDLMTAVASPVDAFLDDLRGWEQDPLRYERDRALNQRISARFVEMILALVRTHLRSGPAYVTQDLALQRDPQSRDVSQALTTQYGLVPQGLVFQLLPEQLYREPAPLRWELRGLSDVNSEFEADDVVRVKVFPVYVSMLYNRGRYLALHGRAAQAISAYEQAVALDPAFAPAQQALAESRRPGQ